VGKHRESVKTGVAGDSLQGTGFDVDDVEVEAPIFITSLPRAGTTILLAALNSVPQLATHLYRDMPFVMAPLLWSRLSGRFRKQAVLQERAHGDGIAIGYDSPEAFEEVIWRSRDNRELRLFTTTIPTSHRFYTLMHDPQYRLSIAWQNVAYNQPPHVGFFLGAGMKNAPRPNITLERPGN